MNNIQVINERWPSNYVMVCDVIDADGSLIENVLLRVNPATGERFFGFPDEWQHRATEAIEDALLWEFYGLPKDGDL
jgi:hypothetical protein